MILRLFALFSYTLEVESGVRSAATAANKKASNVAQVKDGPGVIKVEGVTHIIYRLQIIVD
jgi:hypothetical protein